MRADHPFRRLRQIALIVGSAIIAAVAVGGSAFAQSAPVARAQSSASASASAGASHKTSPFQAQRVTAKAKQYYEAAWGLDKLKVSSTSSGNLIRFSYRVSDAERAKPVASKDAVPYLVGQRGNAILHVPQMDKVGTLRQTAPPQVGQEYWMVFSNKGNLVKTGDHVSVFIGPFHADGLVVE
jgi:hypothetical protein